MPMAQRRAEVIGLIQDPTANRLDGSWNETEWSGPDSLGEFVVLSTTPGLPSPRSPAPTTGFYTLSFPTSRHKLGRRILVPHCQGAHGIKQVILASCDSVFLSAKWKTVARMPQGETPEHLFALTFFLLSLL